MSVEWLLKFSYSWLNDCWTNPTALLSAITSFLLTHDSDRLRAGSSLLSPNTAFYGRIRTRLQIIKPLFLWCVGFTWWVLTVAESQASYKKHICGWNLVWIYDIFPQIVAEILRADVEETTSLVWADVTSYGEAAASTPHVSIRRPIWCLPHVNSDLTRPFDFMYFNQPLSLCSCLTPWSEYSLLMVENVHSPSKRLETSLRGWSFALADLSQTLWHTHFCPLSHPLVNQCDSMEFAGGAICSSIWTCSVTSSLFFTTYFHMESHMCHISARTKAESHPPALFFFTQRKYNKCN